MSVRIGFDEQDSVDVDFEENDQKQPDRKLYEKKLSVYIPERRVAEFLKDYDCVVVQDYGDDYHMSDEERQEKNRYYEVFKNFSRCKHKYRKLDQYVIAMREFFKCLDYVAEKNGIYDAEKFKLMYLRGKIEICGLYMPKFVGKEKKYISMEYLTDFILSDEDPSLIIKKKKVDEVYTEDDYEEMESVMFTEEELDRLLTPISEEEEIIQSLDYDPDDERQENRNIVLDLKNKQLKKMLKNNPDMVKIFKDSKEQQRSLANMSRYAYDITSDDLDQIERYDRKHNFISSSEPPQFKGSLMNDSDFERYMSELEEWEQEHVYDTYAGKTKSLAEIRELELKQLLENNGWNIRALYENKEKEKLLAKQKKRDKKREKELKEKLMEIDRRRRRRMGESDDVGKSSKSKKKKKKDNSKGKVKAGQKEKKRLEKNMDNFMKASSKKNSSVLNWE